MDTFFKKLALIPKDKLLHSFYGTVIYLLLSLFSPIVAILTVIFVAIAKEIYDEVKYKGFDIVDIIATILIPMMFFRKNLRINMFSKIKKWLYCLSPIAIKKDTEKIISLIEEYKKCSNIEEYKEIKSQLRREKNLRNAVLDHLDDMVWCKDLDGKYLMTNKSFRNKFCYGLRDEEILGKTDIELATIFKNKVGNDNHTFGEKCKNSDLVIHEVQEALQFLESGNINGKVMKLVVNKSPIRDYNGKMFGVCGSGRDVTEWHTAMEKAIEGDSSCFPETKNLILQELNKMEFK